jgi:hypothetical protein
MPCATLCTRIDVEPFIRDRSGDSMLDAAIKVSGQRPKHITYNSQKKYTKGYKSKGQNTVQTHSLRVSKYKFVHEDNYGREDYWKQKYWQYLFPEFHYITRF